MHPNTREIPSHNSTVAKKKVCLCLQTLFGGGEGGGDAPLIKWPLSPSSSLCLRPQKPFREREREGGCHLPPSSWQSSTLGKLFPPKKKTPFFSWTQRKRINYKRKWDKKEGERDGVGGGGGGEREEEKKMTNFSIINFWCSRGEEEIVGVFFPQKNAFGLFFFFPLLTYTTN